MNIERLFYAQIEKKLEPVTERDVALLRAVGIKKRPFFKFTQGKETVVVYAYEESGKRVIIKFKSKDNPQFNKELAKKLTENGFCVVEFKEKKDISQKKLEYAKDLYGDVLIDYYEKTAWLGYDYEIQAAAAVGLLEKCKYDLNCEAGKHAYSIIERIGFASGNVLGRMCNHHIFYLDFRAQNLAGDKEVCFFDLGEDRDLQTVHELDRYVSIARDVFFGLMLWYPKGPRAKKIVLSILKGGFCKGLESANPKEALIKKVSKDIDKWG